MSHCTIVIGKGKCQLCGEKKSGILYEYFLKPNLKVAGSRPDEVNDFYQVT
jgi:hypothetical protein